MSSKIKNYSIRGAVTPAALVGALLGLVLIGTAVYKFSGNSGLSRANKNGLLAQVSSNTGTSTAARVFITSQNYSGNLGGLEGADQKCQTLAINAGLGGTWKAWLSDWDTSAASRLTHSPGPYQLLNGATIANSWDDLIDGALAAPINYTETKVTKNFDVYTNTTASGGTKSMNNSDSCHNWTANYAQGYFGGPAVNSGWTDKNLTYNCSSALALYCFEQVVAASVAEPKLTISVSTEPKSQNVIAGTSQFEFARYILDAAGSGEDLVLQSLPLKYTVLAGSATDLTNCKFYSAESSLPFTSGNAVINPTSAESSLPFTFDMAGLLILKGSVKQLSLRCDIKAGATGSYQWGYDSVSSPQVSGYPSGKSATLTENSNPGQVMTAISGGALSVSPDHDEPYQIVTPGETVELLSLRFDARGEDIALKQVALQLAATQSHAPIDLVSQTVTLWDGATRIGQAIFVGDYAISSPIAGFVIPKGSFKVLTVKGTIAGISAAGPLTKSGDLLFVDYDADNSGLSGNYGIGASSGQTIFPTTIFDNQDFSSSGGVRIMRAYPSLEKVNLPGYTLKSQDGLPLYRFKVTAKQGDISIYKFTFYTSSNGNAIDLSKYGLYAFTDSGFSSPDGAFNGMDNPGGLLNCNYLADVAFGFSEIYPNTSCSNFSQTKSSLKIPYGESRWFELRANTTATSATLLSVQLMGDSSNLINGMLSASGVYFANGVFIWSPRSTSTNQTDSQYLNNNDWTNGYGVPGLPSTGMAAVTLIGSGTTQPALTCDATAQAILNSVGGCSQLNASQYPNVYKACCGSVVTKESLLQTLEKFLQDGYLNDQEKAELLRLLDSYLKG